MNISDDETKGAAGFAKIARGLADLFGVLAELDESKLPRRGRREKEGLVMEYSFGKRSLAEAARARHREETAAAEAPTEVRARRAAKPAELDVFEPVMDMFDEPEDVVLLFELPGVERSDIRCLLDGDILLLEAKTGQRLYRKETLIDTPLAEGEPRLALRNGVLEVRMKKG